MSFTGQLCDETRQNRPDRSTGISIQLEITDWVQTTKKKFNPWTGYIIGPSLQSVSVKCVFLSTTSVFIIFFL